jgi:hypothetical protein
LEYEIKQASKQAFSETCLSQSDPVHDF